MAALTKMGSLTVVAAADLADVDHDINVRGDARVGSTGVGKTAGMLVLRDNGGGDYDLAIATGDGATDPWLVYGREATVTPS